MTDCGTAFEGFQGITGCALTLSVRPPEPYKVRSSPVLGFHWAPLRCSMRFVNEYRR
jgi:hypothetical protein